MFDRLCFLLSRCFSPVGNLLTLFLVGYAFGKGAIADYTFALAVCSPIYFFVTFSIPTFIAVQRPDKSNRPEILWTRAGSLLLTLIPAFIVSFSTDPKWAISGALWILKAGDVLFDPVIVFSATDGTSSSRGRRMAMMEALRLLAIQSTLWLLTYVIHSHLALSLVGAGLTNVLVSGCFLFFVPKWSGRKSTLRGVWQSAGSIVAASAPMTISGVFLAIIIGLPRLLLDKSLLSDERTIIGLAQVAGSVFALFFNAGWMYELSALKNAIGACDFRRVLRKNIKLSISYFSALSLASMAILVTPKVLIQRFSILGQHAGLIAFAVFILGLPHCFSVHRDVLKLIQRTWLEVKILLSALMIGIAVWYMCSRVLGWSWEIVTVAMVLSMTAVQGLVAILALSKALSQGMTEPPGHAHES